MCSRWRKKPCSLASHYTAFEIRVGMHLNGSPRHVLVFIQYLTIFASRILSQIHHKFWSCKWVADTCLSYTCDVYYPCDELLLYQMGYVLSNTSSQISFWHSNSLQCFSNLYLLKIFLYISHHYCYHKKWFKMDFVEDLNLKNEGKHSCIVNKTANHIRTCRFKVLMRIRQWKQVLTEIMPLKTFLGIVNNYFYLRIVINSSLFE